MKKVLVVGVFDYFHLGHLRLFKQALEHGNYLIVAVQEEEFIYKTKPEAKVFYSTEERTELIKSIKIVDEVITYKDVDKLLPLEEFDVFALGEDQNHSGFQRAIKWCKEHEKEVVRLKRTPNVSSSEIKEKISPDTVKILAQN